MRHEKPFTISRVVTNTHTCRRCGEGVDCNGTRDQFCDAGRGTLCFDGYCDPCERAIQAEDRAYDAARRGRRALGLGG